jgi:hypothetical protein
MHSGPTDLDGGVWGSIADVVRNTRAWALPKTALVEIPRLSGSSVFDIAAMEAKETGWLAATSVSTARGT